MAAQVQLFFMMACLAYSAGYLLFVAWAAEHPAARKGGKLRGAAFLGGALLPFLGLLMLLPW